MAYQNIVSTTRKEGLSDAQIKDKCPAVFAEEPWRRGQEGGVSEHYAFVPTSSVVGAMRNEGYTIHTAMQSLSRVQGKKGYTKHLLRFRHSEALGEDMPEVVYVGSHDRASSVQVLTGIIRSICSNELVSGDFSDTLKTTHRGSNLLDSVIDYLLKAAGESLAKLEAYEAWKGISLTQEQRLEFARYAAIARWGDTAVYGKYVGGEVFKPPTVIRPGELLIPKYYDRGQDSLYHTFNVVQQNTIGGGRQPMGYSHPRARAVQSVDGVIQINQALWNKATELAVRG